jgi:2,4-dienoyl-CoA reductase (NADPH2)
MDRLNRYGVEIKTGATVLSIDESELIWAQDGKKQSARFDSVVLASGSRSEDHLAKALADAGISHTVVGDGIRPGKLNDAIHGGFLAALEL